LKPPLSLKLKVCLLGDGAVGKTSLIDRFVDNNFSEEYLLTVGTRTSKKEILIRNPQLNRDIHLTLIIWDIMGQTSTKLSPESAFYGTKGALITCDLTRRETLERFQTEKAAITHKKDRLRVTGGRKTVRSLVNVLKQTPYRARGLKPTTFIKYPPTIGFAVIKVVRRTSKTEG